jgi:hypothetical protein
MDWILGVGSDNQNAAVLWFYGPVYPLRELLEEGYFNTSPSRRLIIIDGVDECDTPATQCKVLDVMSLLFHKHHLPLLLLVASRPERHFNHSFNSGSLSEFRATLALDDTYKPDDDVRPFVTDSFKQVQDTHSMRPYLDSSWPSDDDELEGLGEKSSEQFIRGNTHKVIANNQTPRILEVPKGHMTYEMGTSFPSVFSIPEHLK